MPEGLPSADKLIENYNVFFSIDTNIIQALGYKFDSGALSKLALQRPGWMSLYITEVVEKEIKSHRMDAVIDDSSKFLAAYERIQRSSGIDFSSVAESYEKINVKSSSGNIFDEQLKNFVNTFGGRILKIEGENLAADMFELYFNNLPPFESRKDKKNEFPDAAALLVLEKFAKDNRICGVLISADAGWSSFANRSEHLYCVKTLEEFTSLFASSGEKADKIKNQVILSLDDKDSSFSKDFLDNLSKYFEQADWTIDDIYGNSSQRLIAVVDEAILLKDKVEFSGFKVWFVEHDPSMCVVEIGISAFVSLNLSVSSYDGNPLLDDGFFVGDFEYTIDVNIKTDVFSTFHGSILVDDLSRWEYDFVMDGGYYSVNAGLIEDEFFRQDWDK